MISSRGLQELMIIQLEYFSQVYNCTECLHIHLMDWLYSFDPNPHWYVWTLHIITILSTPIYVVGMICVCYVNLTSNGSTYKYLLATNITMSFVTQLSMSLGTIPIFTLPGSGGYPLGILAEIGVPTCFQVATVFTLLAANGLTTVLLFFYRSHVVMPFQRRLTYCLLVYLILVAAVIPSVLNTFVCQTTDSNKTRDNFQRECPDIFALLPIHVIHRTLFILEFNSLLHFSFYFYAYLLVGAVVFVSVFIYRVIIMLRRQIFSKAAVLMHRTLVRCLLIQTLVYYSLYLIPAVALLLLVYNKAVWPGASNLAFIVVTISDPASVLAMILAHKKYRNAVLRSFHRGQTPKRVPNSSMKKDIKSKTLTTTVP